MLDDHDNHDDNGNGLLGMGGLQTMGIVNALKTGDIYLDMLIAMLIPILLRLVFGFLSRLDSLGAIRAIGKWWYSDRFQYERFITYRFQRQSWGGSSSLDPDTQNTVLQKAVRLYLHENCKLELSRADVDLTSMENKPSSDGYCDDYDDDEEGSSSKTLAGTLSKYKIVQVPPKGTWHALGDFGEPSAPIELQITEHEEDRGDDRKAQKFSTTTFHFVSMSANAIDSFIECAYEWYMDKLRSMEDHSRYLYELRSQKESSEGEDGENYGGILYNRYRLSDDKTFASLFFRQKDSLLNIVNHFQAKSGKYAISGYPHKLGVLLHGPPGTGKTSLIKSIAQYTGRSIVSVPLSRISTNSELMDIFFQNRYRVHGQDVPVKLGFRDVIFVMEDVDAASKVVRRRDGRVPGASCPEPEWIDIPSPKSTWRLLLESVNDDACREVVEQLMEKSERLRDAAMDPDVLESIAQRMASIPGLGLIGEPSEDEAVDRIGIDALETAKSAIDGMETVDRFIAVHACTIKAMLEAGTEVSDAFVDEMLGVSPKGIKSIPRCPAARNVSYSRYDEKAEEALFGNDQMLMAAVAMGDESGKKLRSDKRQSDSYQEGIAAGPSLWSSKPKKDELNLTGLLNVLDGVVDTPGRILIMTTNHPEQLDPALIRPGRIDKKIMLGYMNSDDVICMLEHYFQGELEWDQKQRIERALAHLKMTPAQIEQMTAESDELEDMVQVLEEKAGVSSPITAATSFASTDDSEEN